MTDVFDTAGDFTWTCPAGVYFISVRVWNAGASGGDDGGGAAGGGGAGGSFGSWSLFPTPGVVYNVFIGAGGQFGVVPNAGMTAGSGGITAFGGTGAGFGNAAGWIAGYTSPGQSAGCTPTGGVAADSPYNFGSLDFFYSGGYGFCAAGATGGGGGSSAGVGATGSNGASGAGGVAPSEGGDGGDHAAAGDAPGGGGGGASAGEAPGDGGDGRIEIEYESRLAADSGTFLITGQSVSFRYWHLNTGIGSFLLGGQTASLKVGYRLVASSGTFLLTGVATSRAVGSGSFRITGGDVTFPRTYSPGNWSAGFPLPPVQSGRAPSKIPGAPVRS